MQRWEYRLVFLDPIATDGKQARGRGQLSIDDLNLLGQEGWEAISTSPSSGGGLAGLTALLRRPTDAAA